MAVTGCRQLPVRPFPVGIYSVPSTNDFPLVKQAGFNVVQGPAKRAYLDAAQANHLAVLASPGTSAGPNFNAGQVRQSVYCFDAHPALWGWYLADEPDLDAVPPDKVKMAQRYFKNLGARKPTAIVIYKGYQALYYANLADITMVDRYPIPWLPLADFCLHLRQARLALGKDKPLIAVIQAFDWNYFPTMKPKDIVARPPTEPELRCMAFAALAHRANGLFFYAFDSGQWKILEHPECWQALKTVVHEVNLHRPLFEAQHRWWPYQHRFANPATSFNAALESSIMVDLLRVQKGNFKVPEGDYILAVNVTDRLVDYSVTLPKPARLSVPVLDENRFLHSRNGWLTDQFAPYAVHIYGPLK